MDTLEILKNNNLRLTGCRKVILDKMLAADYALSHADLEKALKDRYDRVTIYRTLALFVEEGILHKIPDDEGGLRYAVCADNCKSHNHNDNHLHFKCSVCGKTECIDSAEIPVIQIPKGYKVTEITVIAKGVCRKCKAG